MTLSFTGPESFYTVDEQTWWASVDKALKGMSRQKLFGSTDDGLEIAPLYARRGDTPALGLRPDARNWTITQRIDIADPDKANLQILDDLQGGADGIELVFASSHAGSGIQVDDLAGFEKLLKGVQLDLIKTRVDAGPGSNAAIALLFAFLEKQGIDPAAVEISSGHDPFASSFRGKTGSFGAETSMADSIDLAIASTGLSSPARALNADGLFWHNAGATPAQELGLVVASATAQLRSLEQTRIPSERWADLLSLSLAADADQFGTIAKARAVRALWSCVLQGAGLPQTSAQLHMTSSFRMLTRRDPWVNLLRNTVASFAAGIGGADSFCVLPHTLAVGLPDGLARRLARNTQAILLEESNLAKVMDPAAGSGAIEDRTEKLCAAAWSFFQEIEAAGGLAEALQQGLVQKSIAASKSDQSRNVARRKRPITGVSEFPNLSETPVSVLQQVQVDRTPAETATLAELPEAGSGERTLALKAAALAGQGLPGLEPQPEADASAFVTERLAEPFEQLREVAERFEDKTSSAPVIFLASLGSLAHFTARATWTANAFAAGGITTTVPTVFSTLDDLVAAFRESGASMACLVSSDGVYATEALPAAAALKKAGAGHVYLAGRPGEREAELKASGVDTFLFAGCDLLDLLKDAHTRLAEASGLEYSDLEVLS